MLVTVDVQGPKMWAMCVAVGEKIILRGRQVLESKDVARGLKWSAEETTSRWWSDD